VWFGATSELTVGIIHAQPSVDRFGAAATICVPSPPPGPMDPRPPCPSAYHGSGLDARYRVLSEPLSIAPRLRFLIRDIDPTLPALTIGALLAWTRDRFAISADPYYQVGLANKAIGNRDALFLPITFAVQPLARWEVSLRTGWNSDIAVIEDGWHVPLAIATRVAATAHFDVGAMFGFASLLGPQNTPKERVLFFMVGWRS
jgi:hypothetical protein